MHEIITGLGYQEEFSIEGRKERGVKSLFHLVSHPSCLKLYS